jgi:hypothetical protein
MQRAKSRLRVVKKFIAQFSFAAVAVTGLWFAGVGFSRTILSRPLGGDENGSNGGRFLEGKKITVPKGFVPQPGGSYLRGRNGDNLIVFHRGDPTMNWQDWMSAVHIIALIVIFAVVLALIDRRIRVRRRRRVAN